MTRHLTDVELRNCVSGTASPDALLEADDHLAACEACRIRAAAAHGNGAAADELLRAVSAPEEHLTEEEAQLLVDGRLPPATAARLRQHLDACATCAESVADLDEWARSDAPRRSYRWLAAAAVLALIALVPAIWWLTRGPVRSVDPLLAGLDDVPAAMRTQVEGALSSHTIAPPPFAIELRPGRETLMGGSSGAAPFSVIAPVGTAVVSDRPTFTWQPLAGATFTIAIYDESTALVAKSGSLHATNWTPDQPLPRNRTLVWQVTADRSGVESTVPAPPQPPARFRVLDTTTADTLAHLQQVHAGAHLLIGVLAFQAGAFDVARDQLRLVPAEGADGVLARQALQQIERGH